MRNLKNLLYFTLTLLCGCLCILQSSELKAQYSEDSLVIELVARMDFGTINPGTNGFIPVLANDGCSGFDAPECEEINSGIELIDISTPLFGSVFIEGDGIIYTAPEEYQGVDKFNYTIRNDLGDIAEGLIEIDLDPTFPWPWPLPLPANAHCTNQLPAPCTAYPCSIICNPEFCGGSPVSCDLNQPGCDIPGWIATHGSPNASTGGLTNPGSIHMWSRGFPAGGPWGEGVGTRVNVSLGYTYVLSYQRQHTLGLPQDNFNVELAQNPLATSTAFWRIPNFGGQNVLTETNITSTASEQVVTCFSPNANYSHLLFYGVQNPGNNNSWMRLDQVELMRVDASYEYQYIAACDSVTLTDPNCTISNATWDWYDNNNVFVGRGTSITVYPNSNTTYRSELVFPGAAQNYCTVPVSNNHVVTVEECCCDDFVNSVLASSISIAQTGSTVTFTPPGVVNSTDQVDWDFECNTIHTGSTLGTTSISHTYGGPGSYVACILVTRIQADGDTCRVKQTVSFNIEPDCNDFINETLSSSGILINMSSPPQVDFYPPNNLLATDIAIWDTDCDNSGTVTLPGNAVYTPSPNLSPGWHSICLTVIRIINGIECPVELSTEVFIPEPSNDCCKCDEDFFNNVQLGFTGSIIGNVGTFTPNGNFDPMCDTVNWDYGDGNGNLNAGTGTVTHTYTTTGWVTVCMEVIRVAYDGEICKDKYCWEYFIEEEEPGCLCDDDFFNNVQLGFTGSITGTVGTFTPNGTFDPLCDTVNWDFGDSNTQNNAGTGTVTHTYTTYGWHVACMTVIRNASDGEVCQDTFCWEYFVEEEDPNGCLCDEDFFNNVQLGYTGSIAGTVGTFTPNGTFDPACDTVNWDFGDGNTQNNAGTGTVTHTYTTYGWHVVCMTVIRNASDGEVCQDTFCWEYFVEEEDPNGCLCDEDFFNNVQLGYTGSIAGTVGTFTPNGTFDPACDTVNWDFGDGNTQNNAGTGTVTHTYTTYGWHVVCMTVIRNDSQGVLCEDTYCMEYFIEEEDPTGCICDDDFLNDINLGFNYTISGTQFIFNPIANFDPNCDTITWIWGDGSPDGTTSGNSSIGHYFPLGSVNFVCMLVTRVDIAGNLCEAEYCEEIADIGLATPTMHTDPSVSVFPNPFKEQFSIVVNNIESGTSIELFSSEGRMIEKRELESINESISFQLESLNSGMYILNFRNSKGEIYYSRKVIKQ